MKKDYQKPESVVRNIQPHSLIAASYEDVGQGEPGEFDVKGWLW